MRFAICLSHENSVVTDALPHILRQYHERGLAFALLHLAAVILFIFANLVDEAFLNLDCWAQYRVSRDNC